MTAFVLHRLTYSRQAPLSYDALSPENIRAWFSKSDKTLPAIGTDDDRRHAWDFLHARILADFGIELMRSPALTGRYCMHASLPAQRTGELYQYHTLPDETAALVAQTPQHHIELFQSEAPGGPVYNYDGRVMFLSCLRYLPCLHSPNDLVRDGSPDFLGRFRAARYRCEVTIPTDWQHIGLVPAKVPHSRTAWRWPRTPSETFSCWLSNMEVAMLLDAGWAVAIQERLLFSEKGSDPLRTFSEKMTALLTQCEAMLAEKRTDARLALRQGARAIVLKAIGLLHQDSNRWQQFDMTEETPDGPVRPVKSPQAGTWLAERQIGHKDSLQAAWSRREWSSHIWAMARVKIAQTLLRFPFDSVLAIDGDGFYSSAALDIWDMGKIGDFRQKEAPVMLAKGTPLPTYLAFKKALHLAEKGAL